MEKIIEIDIKSKYDLLEKYNHNKVCEELIDYIIKQVTKIKKRDIVKIFINKKCDFDENTIELIKEGLKAEYKNSMKEHHENNKKQVFFFVMGIVCIFLSTLIKDGGMWKEIVLISGWVPLWEVIDVELFSDYEGRKKRKIITKLLNSEMIEKSLVKVED